MDTLRVSTFGRSRVHERCVNDGIYTAENIDVELDVTQSSKAQMGRLRDGVWDVVHTNADNVYWWNEDNGADFLIVLATPGRPNQSLVVRPEIHSCAELRGKPIAVDASESGYVTPLRILLKKAGLAEEGRDFTFLEVGATQQRIDSMRAGDTFGAMVGSDQAAALEREGFHVLDSINHLYTNYAGGTAVRREWAEKREDLLLRYLRAYLRGQAAEDGKPGQATPRFGWDGLQEMMQMRRDVGLLRGPVDAHRFADDRYFQRALATL
ncbi:MAG TPA: PhnD/SsuA/transferrin family substrate-binding protein [Chloroflexota bacterium]|nr:PhnD/SsuA/transferrin family substrate-binding protein [Chloroflexota bacterium]